MKVSRHLLSRCASDHKSVVASLPLINNGKEFKPQPDSPLLRLPGELRNKIYDLLNDHLDVVIRADHRIVRLNWPGNFDSLSRVCDQIQRELCSYMWHHGDFYIDFNDMSQFFRSFPKDSTYRIRSLIIDVAWKASHGELWDTTQIAKHLLPLCQEGRLQRIVIRGQFGYPEDSWNVWYMQCDKIAQRLRDVELTPENVVRVILAKHHWYDDEGDDGSS